MSKDTKTMLKEMKIRGDYGKATAWMRKKQFYTRSEVIAYFRSIGKEERASIESATVMLSPRESSKRGDPRGNRSNPFGHLAYNKKLKRVVTGGVKEEQRFQFSYRKDALEPRKRYDNVAIESEKVESKTDVKVVAKGRTKAKSKKKTKTATKAKAK